MAKTCLFHLLVLGGLLLPQFAPAQERQSRKEATLRIELTEPLPAEKTLEERPELKGTFEAERATLSSFATELEKAIDTSVMLIPRPREPIGYLHGGNIPLAPAFDTKMPLTYKLKNVRVRTALKLILEERGLTYYIDDNVLLISTLGDSWERLERRVYDCRPLLKMPSSVRINRDKRPIATLPHMEVIKPTKPPGPDGGYTVEDLIEVITGIVEPDSWDNVGGDGSLGEFKGLVTIKQTRDVHAKVESLLNMLHKSGGIEEKVKVSR